MATPTIRSLALAAAAHLLLAGCVGQPIREAAGPDDDSVHREILSAIDALDRIQGFQSGAFGISKPKKVATTADPVLEDQPSDLWERLRGGFQLRESAEPRVMAELDWYASHPKFMERTVERAEPYLHFIVEEIEKRGMPGELALLPVVESAFQPFAYSHGRAAGLWQFIPSTGERFGLKQNWWYDGRRDVVASTGAALDYLEYLHNEFDGDWLLALAAYNSGEGNVARAVRINQRRNMPTDFWHLDLPNETRMYVPKLLAISALVAEPESYGLDLPVIPNEPTFAMVDVGSQIDLAVAAQMADLSLEELYRYNPGYNRWATDPDGPFELVLPVDRAAVFEERLAEYPPESRVGWDRHRVGRGETLSQIADRYHTTVAVLQEVNHLRGTRLRTGQHLIIPQASQPMGEYVLSQDERLKRTQERERPGERRDYAVRSGDTLWDLSRRFGVSVAELAKWNGMAPRDPLRPGQKLVVWVPGQAPSPIQPVVLRAPDLKSTLPAQVERKIGYTVRKGDSLSRIAGRFKVSVADLQRWNKLDSKHYLRPGQHLTLYVDVTQQTGI